MLTGCFAEAFFFYSCFALRFEGMFVEILDHRLKAGQVALQQGLDNFAVKVYRRFLLLTNDNFTPITNQ